MTHQPTFSERVIELPEFLTCSYHGEYSWEAYYDPEEITEMIDEQGFIDCPLCLIGICDTH